MNPIEPISSSEEFLPFSKNIIGIDVRYETVSTALSSIYRNISLHNPTVIAFANANLLNKAVHDTQLKSALKNAYVLNDGSGVNIASRILYGISFPDNMNGTDFVPLFLGRSTAGLKIYLLGARPDVLIKACEYVRGRWPEHTLVGSQHGYFSDAEAEDILVTISRTEPDIVLVAMGNGLQETIAQQLISRGVRTAWAVGALFDFWVGIQPRAPQIFRNFGIEWVFRLYREPSRLWRRYILGNPLFLLRVAMQKIKMNPSLWK
jgi:exopolysaccharide biosynthesis WecB/TagA/CpsF family protein